MPLLRAPDGKIVNLPDEQAGQAIAGGYIPVSIGEAAQTTTAPEREDRGVLGSINAGLTGALSGVTLGLSDYALRGLLSQGQFDRLIDEREGHPIASGVGQVAGSVLPALVAPESLLGRMPAGALSHSVAPLIESGRALGGIAGAGRVLAAGAIEGAVQNAGAYLSDTALGDRDLSAEGMFAALGAGGSFGTAGGAVALGIEKGTIAARRMFSRAAGTNRAALEAEQAWRVSHDSTIEANDAAAEVAKAKLAEARGAREQAALEKQRTKLKVVETKQAAPEIDATRARTVVEDEQLRSSAAEPAPAELTPERQKRGGDLAMMADLSPTPESLSRLLAEDDALQAARGAGLPADKTWGVGSASFQRGSVDEAALSEALAEHAAARDELESMLRSLEAPQIEPGIASQSHGVPVGEFGAPGQRGYTPGEVKPPGPPSIVDAQTGDITAIGRKKFAQGTPAVTPAIEPAADTLTGQLRGMQGELDAGKQLGRLSAESPAREQYVVDKLAKRTEDAAHFRAKAIEGHDVPTYDVIGRHEAKADDYFEQTLPARKIADRGYFEPSGGGIDPVRVEKARMAISEGQREAIKLNVSPTGAVTVTDGRHRLAAAIEAEAPIKVKWSTGSEPAPNDVLRAAPRRAAEAAVTGRGGSELSRLLSPERMAATDAALKELVRPKTRQAFIAKNLQQAMREEGSHASAMARLEHEWAQMSGHPLSVAKLEHELDMATERAATATEPAARAAGEQEAQTIEQQLSRVGARPGAVEDIAALADTVTKYERSGAKLTETLGPEAPPAAQEAAKAFRAAEDAADRKTLDRTTRAIDSSVDSNGRPNVVVQRVKGPTSVPAPAPTGSGTIRNFADLERVLGPAPLPPTAKEALAGAKAEHGASDVALQRAKIAEGEAKISARQATELASQTRSATASASSVAAPPSQSMLGSIATGIGVAGELGVPGVPKPHDIPVIGPLLSMYLKYRAIKAAAGRFTGRVSATADSRAAALAARTKDKIANAVDRTLGLVAESAPKARGAAVAAATVLGHRVFDDGEPDAKRGASAQELAAVRIREIANAVSRPDLVEAYVRKELRDVVDPDLIAAAEAHMMARFRYLNSVAPKAPAPNPYTKREWVPSAAAASDLAQRIAVIQDPEAAFRDTTPAKVDALKNGWPKLLEFAQQRLIDRIGDAQKPVPYQQRLKGSLLFGVQLDDSLQSVDLLQSAHAETPVQSTAPAPSIATPTNLSSLYQPGSDRRAMQR